MLASSYATHQIRIPDGLIKEKVVVAGASHDQPVGVGMLLYEDGNWSMTSFGTGKAEATNDISPRICDRGRCDATA